MTVWNRLLRPAVALATALFCLAAVAQPAPPDAAQPPAARRTDRTPAESKLDMNLMYAARMFAPVRGAVPAEMAAGVQQFVDANVAPDRSIFVVIRGTVTSDLVDALKVAGAYDISEFPQYETVTARVPITALVGLAQRSDIRSIGPQEQYRLNRWDPPEGFGGAITQAGSVLWQGVGAHKADVVQNAAIMGAGAMVCVLSNGVFSLASRQASGDLPPSVFILPGQGNQVAGNDEGTAMLEIIYDIAPGASLGFATANPSQAQFATNIIGLQAAGCNIIVDDVTYFAEGPFQDGTVAQAVNTVTAAGVLYFSSAANSGSVKHASSGTHEHDFVASASAIPATILAFEGAPPAGPYSLHQFGVNAYTTLTATTSRVSLHWASPLSGSDSTDYDLFVMDSTGTNILGVSAADQYNGGLGGTAQPFEFATCSTCPFPVGARIYVIKYAGGTRALRIDANRGVINAADATTGSTFGHNAAASALTVASTGYNGGAFLNSTPFTSAAVVDYFSSDGPRRMFFNPNGTQITPGNILFATGGGTLVPKDDLTASDCGSTTTPGFTPFCGTSAAAPSAAAIAALIKSAKPSATKAQVTTALLNSAIDIESAGTDINSGVGIVMADAAVRGVLSPLVTTKAFNLSSIVSGGTSTLTITLQNTNAVAINGVAFTDTYPAQIKNSAAPSPSLSGAGCTGVLTAAANGGSLALSTGVVPAGITCTIQVTVTSSTVGTWSDDADAIATTIGLAQSTPAASLTVGGGVAPPVLQSGKSRKVHGVAGTFDLPLMLAPPVNHNPSTEPRSGPAQSIVFTFDKPVISGNAAVTEGIATAGAPTFAGNDMTVPLTNVNDKQYVTVDVSNVASSDGGTGGVGNIRIGFLVGNVTQSRQVLPSDVGLVRSHLLQPVGPTNFVYSVTLGSQVAPADVGLTRSKQLNTLPAP
jgi:uncharacterized repeat protein (TIGR01451 family)